MRTAALCLTLAGVAVLFAGCASHPRRPGPPPASSPELVSRFEAAAAISDTATRDLALAKVAWLAAQVGDARVAINCLGTMSVSPVRDDAAYQCSGRLADDGWAPQAVAVAKMIGDPAVRDRALTKIAQSNPYPIPAP